MRRVFSGGLVAVAFVIGSAPLWVARVHADQVHLVGGTQLEGKATRQGDKVVVEMESGQIVLSADSVERIERGQSTVQRYELAESKLQPGDVKARLALADFCRDHAMPARERALLRQVIELDADQPEARARLGYVRTPAGWVTHDEQMRARGFVRRDGQWLSQERALELDRLHAEADAAARDRERAQAALDAQRAELAARQRELDQEAERIASQPPAAVPSYGYGYGYGYGLGYWPGHGAAHGPGPRPWASTPGGSGRPFPIAGVRDPRSTSWPLNGVRDPRSY
jgi:hypothetical protein